MSETEHDNPALEPEGATAPSEAPETPAEEQPTEREKEQASRYDKRIGYLRSQATQAARDRDEMAARLAAIEMQLRAGGQAQPDPQQIIQAEAQRLAEQQRTQDRINSFHSAGRDAYPDWQQRCNDLQAMGADAQIAALLVEMPDGHRIAAALRDTPEELEHIASLRGERARAIALGQFAERATAKPTRAVSRAPAPPRPIQGRASPVFNEQQATTEQLVEHYARQAMEQRRAR
jgi:hypothetical protein